MALALWSWYFAGNLKIVGLNLGRNLKAIFDPGLTHKSNEYFQPG